MSRGSLRAPPRLCVRLPSVEEPILPLCFRMYGHHDATLVVVSILIAIFASYAALALASRVTAARGRFRLAWLVGGSVAMGMGIWI